MPGVRAVVEVVAVNAAHFRLGIVMRALKEHVLACAFETGWIFFLAGLLGVTVLAAVIALD